MSSMVEARDPRQLQIELQVEVLSPLPAHARKQASFAVSAVPQPRHGTSPAPQMLRQLDELSSFAMQAS